MIELYFYHMVHHISKAKSRKNVCVIKITSGLVLKFDRQFEECKLPCRSKRYRVANPRVRTEDWKFRPIPKFPQLSFGLRLQYPPIRRQNVLCSLSNNQ